MISILACKVILSNQMILSQFCCGIIAIESPKLRHALPLSARCSSLVSGTALPHASAKDSTGRHHQPDPGLHHPQDSPSRAGLLPAVSEIVPQPQPLDVSDELPQQPPADPGPGVSQSERSVTRPSSQSHQGEEAPAQHREAAGGDQAAGGAARHHDG